MSLLRGNKKVYLSSDLILNEYGHLESELYTMSTETLNPLNCSGIPQHKLVLKIGVPVMLLHNIDRSIGLCNGTRMQVRRLGDHVIECVILTRRNVGQVVFISRMNMVPVHTLGRAIRPGMINDKATDLFRSSGPTSS
ncbi:hypothetical protein Ahy_A07g034300 [Arachis hypogaea]|uniref:DNA helicase Pif1-like 2B domain-containing protein n=1 Tax=Arachis hypogaea TaxID=3818 RepID=A0A445CBH2_ARAHY|nr:hypothetical protein Ahy_A07g034300 [Arachis hypogaea]